MNQQKRHSLTLVGILLLSLGLRCFKLGQLPPGFWFDESAYAYSAYSILKTGRDEFGRFLPLTLPFFGQNNFFLHFWLLIPAIAILGLKVTSVRLVSALLGVLTTYGIYLLTKLMFKSKPVGIFSALAFSLMPLALQFNRMVHENNSFVCLLVFGTYFFYRGLEAKTFKKNQLNWLLAALLLALSWYTYLVARAFLPLFLVFNLVFFYQQFKPVKRLFKPALIFILISLSFFWFLVFGSAWRRVGTVSVFNDQGVILRLEEQRSRYDNPLVGRVFHNKLTEFGQQILSNYFSHLQPEFLFFQGDPNELYATPGVGILTLWQGLFLLVGIISLWRQRVGQYLIVWSLLSFLPAALTRFAPSASRSFQVAPALSLLIGFGLSRFFVWSRQLKFSWRGVVLAAGLTFIILNQAKYLEMYYCHFKQSAYSWRTNTDQAVKALMARVDNYDQAVISQEAVNHTNFLFFSQYEPSLVQASKPVLTAPDQYGNSFIPQINQFQFVAKMPEILEDGVIYLGFCKELPTGNNLATIAINDQEAFCLREK